MIKQVIIQQITVLILNIGFLFFIIKFQVISLKTYKEIIFIIFSLVLFNYLLLIMHFIITYIISNIKKLLEQKKENIDSDMSKTITILVDVDQELPKKIDFLG